VVDFWASLPPIPSTPTVAISECLVGGEVRYDGGHKKSSMPHDALEGVFRYTSVCPEVGIGMSVPRDPIRLVIDQNSNVESQVHFQPRAVGIKDSSLDVTQPLQDFAESIAPRLGAVDGHIFTKNSPSCGLFRVKLYRQEGLPPLAEGRGIYASAVSRKFPDLPLEENGRLQDPVLRENFVTRVYVHAHWRALTDAGISAKSLIAFHSAYKYLVMAHSNAGYKRTGRLLSDLTGDLQLIASQYFSELMSALTTPVTRGGHANVMSHLQGYVKHQLTSSARQELADLIERYRQGELPLLAPMTLLKHHLGEHEAGYALQQFYLQPHPTKAGLRRSL